ncbi:MAG: sensor histidine kinase [Limisphaerales bacterium]
MRRTLALARSAGSLLRGLLAWLAVAVALFDAGAQEPASERRNVPLPERAWVRYGDDPAWAAADLDPSGWTEVNLRGALRRQGMKEDPEADFLWYRFDLPTFRFPAAASLNIHLAGVSGATQGFVNGRPTAQTPQDFTGRIGKRPRFPPQGFTHSYRIRESQWRRNGTNVFVLRIQRGPRADGIEEGPSHMGFALWMRPLQEAAHRHNDLWEGMALAGVGLGLLTALALTIADRADWFSRGMIPVFAVLACCVVLNGHAFFRTPWAEHWTMRAGWLGAAAAALVVPSLPGRLAGVRSVRYWLPGGMIALIVGLGLMLASGFPQMHRAHQALTVAIGLATLVCAAWARRGLAAGHPWLLPVLVGLTALLGAWTCHRWALQLGFERWAAATRPHYYALALAGLFFGSLVLRLKHARDDYRRLLRLNLTAQEDERRRIARDLHDGVGQALQALKLRLQLERRQRGEAKDPALSTLPQTPDSVDAMDGCIRELRAVAGNLRPVYLGRMPLAEALQVHAEQFGRDAGLTVRFHASLSAPLPAATEEHLFRIQQESLNNAVKHGRPGVIDVRLETIGPNLRLTIADDGRNYGNYGSDGGGRGGDASEGGCSSASTLTPNGHGLRNLRERAELLGGTMRFEPGSRGASVVVEVPLRGVEAP